ncbi:hypothetical protein BT96DRAFT_39962 [Gymnopus androsaceus JB14]|uniref:Uncharacterized protein n=1 Tax=Gymnopus androsaceus JB14 TaxID=1447944 RepID=A0A6A4GDC1_9AGAR|nr:hypothetical protein BT96DRAFT_39962 [Gymnopus androsaceus JB14]
MPCIRPFLIRQLLRHAQYWEHCDVNHQRYPLETYMASMRCLADMRQRLVDAWEQRGVVLDLPPCDSPDHPGSTFAEAYSLCMTQTEGGLYKEYRYNPIDGLWALRYRTSWDRTCCSVLDLIFAECRGETASNWKLVITVYKPACSTSIPHPFASRLPLRGSNGIYRLTPPFFE